MKPPSQNINHDCIPKSLLSHEFNVFENDFSRNLKRLLRRHSSKTDPAGNKSTCKTNSNNNPKIQECESVISPFQMLVDYAAAEYPAFGCKGDPLLSAFDQMSISNESTITDINQHPKKLFRKALSSISGHSHNPKIFPNKKIDKNQVRTSLFFDNPLSRLSKALISPPLPIYKKHLRPFISIPAYGHRARMQDRNNLDTSEFSESIDNFPASFKFEWEKETAPKEVDNCHATSELEKLEHDFEKDYYLAGFDANGFLMKGRKLLLDKKYRGKVQCPFYFCFGLEEFIQDICASIQLSFTNGPLSIYCPFYPAFFDFSLNSTPSHLFAHMAIWGDQFLYALDLHSVPNNPGISPSFFYRGYFGNSRLGDGIHHYTIAEQAPAPSTRMPKQVNDFKHNIIPVGFLSKSFKAMIIESYSFYQYIAPLTEKPHSNCLNPSIENRRDELKVSDIPKSKISISSLLNDESDFRSPAIPESQINTEKNSAKFSVYTSSKSNGIRSSQSKMLSSKERSRLASARSRQRKKDRLNSAIEFIDLYEAKMMNLKKILDEAKMQKYSLLGKIQRHHGFCDCSKKSYEDYLNISKNH
jgi:hypothetical protein